MTNQEGEDIGSDCGVGKVEYLKEFGFYNVSNIENSIHELIFQDYVVEVIGNIHDNYGLMDVTEEEN